MRLLLLLLAILLLTACAYEPACEINRATLQINTPCLIPCTFQDGQQAVGLLTANQEGAWRCTRYVPPSEYPDVAP